ncbi:unnamed protein product [Rangifer tarandus platyrhynchus]|uniref:Uncharacterized protein n=1 Tax=Rangifer tarandus platyrhynchus TaxID=3082113 RepID=A0AC59Z4R3_RANTA
MQCLVTQSCPTLCDPVDCSQPDSSVHGIFQAKILEWVPKPSSRRSSQPRDRTRSPTLQVDSLPAELPGKPSIPPVHLIISPLIQCFSQHKVHLSHVAILLKCIF